MLINDNALVTDQLTDAHWKSLRYFSIYRVCVAALLIASSIFQLPGLPVAVGFSQSYVVGASEVYGALAFLSLVALRFFHSHFNRQLSISVLVDVLAISALMHLGGGVRSGLAIMLLVTLAGAGLVGQGRLVLLYASMGTVAVLGEQAYGVAFTDAEAGDFFQVGLLCAGFFGVAITARLLARRVIANEQLAIQRGIDLHNQVLISQRAIEEMQDGVLVLSQSGLVRQHNPQAEQLLGLGAPSERPLAEYSTELARGFAAWCEREGREPVMVRAPASGMQLRARFIRTESSERDVLVFLEDMSRLQEQSRQMKLAALGRLTASIAHEIRNPLSAIKHAGELMQEESHDATQDRLLRIVHDNAQRVERIVSDVLELGRRDRAHRELIKLNEALPGFVDEFILKEGIPAEVVQASVDDDARLCFDRAHLYQVLGNLFGNALRYSKKLPGSIRLQAKIGSADGTVELHVSDDGCGVAEDRREQIFEPFFTTHSRGTGLGLYIAKELCDANGARLELLAAETGAHFCIYGRSDLCQ